MRNHPHLSAPSVKQHGFSMLETLITLVIIAIALLGTAGLQISALRMGKSGQFRNQAVFLASDISERMEANKTGAVAGSYLVNLANTVSTTAANCGTGATAACDASTMASWDIHQWESNIIALLPQPSWVITRTGINPSTYTIQINWVDRSSDKNNHGEAVSIVATRTISN